LTFKRINLMKQNTNSTENSGGIATFKKLIPYMWPKERPDLRWRILWASVFLLFAKLLTLGIPYTFKWATDALNGNEIKDIVLPSLLLVPIALVMSYNLTRIVSTGLNQLRDSLFASVGQYAVRKLAMRTFVHMHELSLRFHLERRTGGLSRVIERGTKGIENIVRFTILATVPTVIEFGLTAVVLGFQYSFMYVLVVAITVWLYTWFTVKASNWRINIRKEMNDSDSEANTKSVDSLLNFETVKYFGNENWEAARFDSSMARFETASTKTWVSLGWLNFGRGLIYGLGMTVMMVLSAREVQAGTQTIGDFVLINALLIQLAMPLNFIGMIYREIRQGLTDMQQMFDLLDVKKEVTDDPNAKNLIIDKGGIKFENVHFFYDPSRPILKGVSFEVPFGKTVAVVGPSGAGKSTLSRLLFRFYDVNSGKITIDDQDIRGVTQVSLRSAIGMVPQDTVLFNDTIAYNIKYGRVDASFEDVQKAAELAQIDHFIKILPGGYQAMVGERGLKLSGGEKQRVAIARTILKAPPILILDEATSALDTNTEQEIQAALDLVSQGRTTLVIAHRLSTIINADEIIVLKDGMIAEKGSHSILLNKKGLYAAMWDRQREATEAYERLRIAQENDELGVVVRRKNEPQ
jgi:ATP-binding cassette, subfamily B, heavy metal transporter